MKNIKVMPLNFNRYGNVQVYEIYDKVVDRTQ